MTKEKKKKLKEQIFYYIIKRTFDLICAIFGMVILLPVMIIVKICNILSGDFSSMFYTQERIGWFGKPFKLYKFRTMVPDADEILFELLKNNPELAKEYKKNKKLQNDPRVTKVGKILRSLSLDELPQMLNILKGDMAMIGNRPYLPREKKDMGEYYKNIVSTKPGLTGYWQTNGRNGVTFESRLKLENEYSNIYSLKIDTIIFFKTFKVVFTGKDSY